jgi:hypothetical protein
VTLSSLVGAAKLDQVQKFLGNAARRINANNLNAGQGGTSVLPSAFERAYQGPRTEMLVTTRRWTREGRYVRLWVNPSEFQWTMKKRETVTKTAAGAVRNTWRNRYRDTYYDEPMLSITFQTGNIMPYANLKPSLFGARQLIQNQVFENELSPRDTRWNNAYDPTLTPELAAVIGQPPVPPGLQNLYDFIELIDQPILERGKEMENRHILFYRTQVFPQLRVEGYFTPEGISFTESVDNANRLTWTAQFEVYKTTPPLWGKNAATALKSAYSAAMLQAGFATGLIAQGIDLSGAQQQQPTSSVLPTNPTDPDKAKLKPKAKTPKSALVNKKGQTGDDLKKVIDTTNKATSENVQKTIDAFVKKYQLKEPEKSKFIAEMKKFERQRLGEGSYAPRSQTNEYAATVLAAIGAGAV